MRKYISFLLMLITLNSCCFLNMKLRGRGWEKKIYAEEVTDVIWRYGLYLQRHNKFKFEHSFACYDEQIDKIMIFLSTQDILEVCAARKLLVEVVEGLLTRINENSFVKHEMQRQPFSADDVQLYIKFESFHGVYVDPTYVGYITLFNGWVNFFAFDIENPTIDFWHSRTETYVQSKQLVMIEREEDIPYAKEPIPGANDVMRIAPSPVHYHPAPRFSELMHFDSDKPFPPTMKY